MKRLSAVLVLLSLAPAAAPAATLPARSPVPAIPASLPGTWLAVLPARLPAPPVGIPGIEPLLPLRLPGAGIPDLIRPCIRLAAAAPAPAAEPKPTARETLKRITRDGAANRRRLDEEFDNLPREERGVVIAPSLRVSLPEADLERELGLTR